MKRHLFCLTAVLLWMDYVCFSVGCCRSSDCAFSNNVCCFHLHFCPWGKVIYLWLLEIKTCIFIFRFVFRDASHSSLWCLFLNVYIQGSPCHLSLNVYCKKKLLLCYSHTSLQPWAFSLFIYIQVWVFSSVLWWTQWTLFLQNISYYIPSVQQKVCVV